MIVERTFDIDKIKYIALNPELIGDLLESNCSIDDCGFDAEYDCYLAIKKDDELIGLYILKPISKTVLDLHPMILPKYRKYSLKSMKSVFNWILNHCNDSVKKVVAQFPATEKNIKSFAIKCGFKEEGVNRLSFLKDKKLVDQIMVGITLDEIKEAVL